jgi:hypothetical protein
VQSKSSLKERNCKAFALIITARGRHVIAGKLRLMLPIELQPNCFCRGRQSSPKPEGHSPALPATSEFSRAHTFVCGFLGWSTTLPERESLLNLNMMWISQTADKRMLRRSRGDQSYVKNTQLTFRKICLLRSGSIRMLPGYDDMVKTRIQLGAGQ